MAALRRRDLAAVESLLSAHLLHFYGEIATLLPVDAGAGPEAR